MTLNQLTKKLDDISDIFSRETQFILSTSHCDEDTKLALDDIARQTFYALSQTQSAIIDYLKSQN